MTAVLDHPHRHLISADEYLRMGAAGVFGPEARLELIEGEIFDIAPMRPPHAGLVNRLTELFFQRLGDRAHVGIQRPILVSATSMPQPDLSLVRRRADYYFEAHPGVSDTFLVVEVADTTLDFDLGAKAALYGRSGVAELWVVDVNQRVVHAFHQPAAHGYRSASVVRSSERVVCGALSAAAIEVGELFPWPLNPE